MRRALISLTLAVGVFFFFAAFVAPLAAAIYSAIFETPDLNDLGLGQRRIGLLLTGIGIAAGGSLIALILGSGFAAGINSGRVMSGVCVIVAMLTLLTPPAMLAYAWSLPLLPNGLFVANTHGPIVEWLMTRGRAVALTGVRLSPIAAGMLVIAWRGAGRQAMALALQDARPAKAMTRAVPGVMAPWLLATWVICFGVGLSEYAICHVCLIQTWSTELLAVAQSAGPTVALSWPLIAIALIAILVILPMRRRWREAIDRIRDSEEVAGDARWGRGFARFAAIVACAACLSSGVILCFWMRDFDSVQISFIAYAGAWPRALAMGATAALFSATLALVAECARKSGTRAIRGVATTIALLALIGAIAPAAVIAEAYLVLRNGLVWIEAGLPIRPSRVFDWWLILSIATTTRFAIVPIVATRIAARLMPGSVEAMSRLEAMTPLTRFARIGLPLVLPATLAGAVAVFALSIGEVAVTSVLAPPGAPIVGQTLLAQIHFGRNDDVVAFCVVLLVFCVVCAISAILASRLRITAR
ncbi:MAG: hypothetical protein KDA32_01240 [Phycisphaerales bacterium]|nr:hypothetical protein [Phycisphaerales bacterium]